MQDKIITIIGSTYFQPILDLAEKMLLRPKRKLVAGRIGGLENGYALSISLLLVVALESYVGRVSYLQSMLKRRGVVKAPGNTIPDYILKLRRSFRLAKSLTEVFVLRDTIAHGHVWEFDVSDHSRHGQVLHEAKLFAGYGDKKYRIAINPRTRRAAATGLNLVPSAVGIEDVIKVFSIVRRTLKFLVAKKLIEPNAIAYRGRLSAKPFDFWSLEQVLKNAA